MNKKSKESKIKVVIVKDIQNSNRLQIDKPKKPTLKHIDLNSII